MSRFSVNTAWVSPYFDYLKLPCYGKNNVDDVWRHTQAECDVCVSAEMLPSFGYSHWELWDSLISFCACSVTLKCAPQEHESRHSDRDLLSGLHTVSLLVAGLEDTIPAHCTADTALRGPTTQLILETQPQQWRVSQASHSYKWLAATPEVSKSSNLFLKWFAAEAPEVKFQHWCHYVG